MQCRAVSLGIDEWTRVVEVEFPLDSGVDRVICGEAEFYPKSFPVFAHYDTQCPEASWSPSVYCCCSRSSQAAAAKGTINEWSGSSHRHPPPSPTLPQSKVFLLLLAQGRAHQAQRELQPIVTLFVVISLFIMKLIFRSADEENGPWNWSWDSYFCKSFIPIFTPQWPANWLSSEPLPDPVYRLPCAPANRIGFI